MYVLNIAAAAKGICLEPADYVANDLAAETLVAARKRGVTVPSIVPGLHKDANIVQGASRSHWLPLLDASVQDFRFRTRPKPLTTDNVRGS